jgi:hypothetical protein
MLKLDTVFTREKEMSEKRLEVCRECEHLEKKLMRCNQCGCFMNFKTLMKSAECPIGKWGKENG